MGTCIIGGGIAGLTTSIKLKLANPAQQVLLLDSNNSNSQIAGQRYRLRGAKINSNEDLTLLEALASRHNGQVTSGMELFASLGPVEVNFWEKLADLPFVDRPEWFGPKFGGENRNAGRLTLEWFRTLAYKLGVQLVMGEVLEVNTDNTNISSIIFRQETKHHLIHADSFVFAGGNPGGKMFLSTNKRIDRTPHELLASVGCKLVDLNKFMIHPFGKSNLRGNALLGCFETDELAGAKVYKYDQDAESYSDRDKDTEVLLADHTAHYHFRDLATEFTKHGGVVKLELPNGEVKFARVAHHYSQIAVETVENVRIASLGNAFAVGDTAGVGRYTGHEVRLPGMGLTSCLIDAELASKAIPKDNTEVLFESIPYLAEKHALDTANYSLLRATNTDYLLKCMLQDNPQRTAFEWGQELQGVDAEEFLVNVSRQTARSFQIESALQDHQEPKIEH